VAFAGDDDRDGSLMYAQTIRIYLRHHTRPQLRPTAKVCHDWTDRKGITHRGCGACVVRYVTFPNQKGIFFDREPRQSGEPVAIGDGGIVATVYTDQVHFATCGMREHKETA
jgi:hypothetical protein